MSYKFRFKNTDIAVDSSWKDFFTAQKETLEYIEKNIKDNFTPEPGKVFNVFSMPQKKIRFVILGQDPYPQKGTATGRAFEVSGVTEWSDKKINRSLQNILKSIYYSLNKKKNPAVPDIKTVLNNIDSVLKPHKLFDNFERNGVMFLNISLTCETDKPASHKKLWKPFSDALIKLLAENKNIKWLIWGGNAKKAMSGYKKIKKTEACHPSPRGDVKNFITNSGLDELKDYCIKK